METTVPQMTSDDLTYVTSLNAQEFQPRSAAFVCSCFGGVQQCSAVSQGHLHLDSWTPPCGWSLNEIYLTLSGERHCLFIKPVNFGQLATSTIFFFFFRMYIWQWQQKVYGLYQINSNIAHLQLGWRKKKHKIKTYSKQKGLIFIFKKRTDELWYSWTH